MQGAFGGPQAAQQQQMPQYGAGMGYGHPSQYYNNVPPYGVNSGYGGGFQQPTAGYSGYGVRHPSTPALAEPGMCSPGLLRNALQSKARS